MREKIENGVIKKEWSLKPRILENRLNKIKIIYAYVNLIKWT